MLGLLSAIGPFAIDMYLPALPSIGADLQASTAAVQMSLLIFFLSMGFGQIVVGPISDMVGRKLPLYGGLALFMVGSIGSALAPSIEWLIAFRFLQGLGASAGMAVPRAIVRDLHTGTEAAELMSLLMLVFSVSPILAPLTGSVIIENFGWRAVFWTVTVGRCSPPCLLATSLKETRPVEARVGSSFGTALPAYRFLMGDRNFLGLTASSAASGMSSFFVYLASSSFVLIDHYGLSPSVYSVFFSINAVAFFGMSQLTGMLTERFGLRRGGAGRGRRLCDDDGGAARGHGVRRRPARRHGGAAVRRLRVPRPGHPDDFGAGHGRAWRDRRHGLGADGHAALRHRRGRHGLPGCSSTAPRCLWWPASRFAR